jgi:hypothetical protein
MSIINSKFAGHPTAVQVKRTAEAVVVSALAEYGSLNNGNFMNLTYAFEVGCLLADYSLVLEDAKYIDAADDAKDHFSPMQGMTFVGEDGSPLEPLTTIGVFDRKNLRMAYVVVNAIGYNMVYFTRTQATGTGNTEIDLIATDSTRAAHRIYNYWRDRSTFAKVMLASLFGFEFDDNNDEIIVPPTRCQHTFSMTKQIAAEMAADIAARS